MPIVTKQLLAPGTYWSWDAKTQQAVPVTYTRRDLREFCRNGLEMLRAGLPIPVPLAHDPLAVPPDVSPEERLAKRAADLVRNNTGWVKDFSLDADGSWYTTLEIEDPEVFQKLPTTIKYVSPQIHPEFTDGRGRTWRNVCTHVALTTQPVWSGQRPFGSDGARLMSLEEPLAQGETLFREYHGGPLQLSLHDVIRFAWQAAKSRKGTTKAIGSAEHAGKVLYGKRAEAALRGRKKAQPKAKAQPRAKAQPKPRAKAQPKPQPAQPRNRPDQPSRAGGPAEDARIAQPKQPVAPGAAKPQPKPAAKRSTATQKTAEAAAQPDASVHQQRLAEALKQVPEQELAAADKKAVNKALGQLKRHHGENVKHRIRNLAEADLMHLANGRGDEATLRKRIQGYREMLRQLDGTTTTARPAAQPAQPEAAQIPDVEAITEKMRQLDGQTDTGAMVSLRELRDISPELDKKAFDQAILSAAETGRLAVHRHNFPDNITPEQKQSLVTDGRGNFFMGVSVRLPTRQPQPEAAATKPQQPEAAGRPDGLAELKSQLKQLEPEFTDEDLAEMDEKELRANIRTRQPAGASAKQSEVAAPTKLPRKPKNIADAAALLLAQRGTREDHVPLRDVAEAVGTTPEEILKRFRDEAYLGDARLENFDPEDSIDGWVVVPEADAVRQRIWTAASDEEVSAASNQITELTNSMTGKSGYSSLVPLHLIREKVKTKDRGAFDLAALKAWQEGKIGLEAVSDLGDKTRDQLNAGIRDLGGGTLFFAEPRQGAAKPQQPEAAAPSAQQPAADPVQAAVGKLQNLYERFNDPSDDPKIAEAVSALAAHDAATVKKIAQGFGIKHALPSKGATLRAIEHKIGERRARRERAEAFSKGTPIGGGESIHTQPVTQSSSHPVTPEKSPDIYEAEVVDDDIPYAAEVASEPSRRPLIGERPTKTPAKPRPGMGVAAGATGTKAAQLKPPAQQPAAANMPPTRAEISEERELARAARKGNAGLYGIEDKEVPELAVSLKDKRAKSAEQYDSSILKWVYRFRGNASDKAKMAMARELGLGDFDSGDAAMVAIAKFAKTAPTRNLSHSNTDGHTIFQGAHNMAKAKPPYDPEADEDDDGISREHTPEEGEADDFEDVEDLDDEGVEFDTDEEGGESASGDFGVDEPEESSIYDDLEENQDAFGSAEEDDVSEEIAEASEGLARIGVMVDPAMDPAEFLRHLCTALKTYHATKDGPEMAQGQIDTNNPQGVPTLAGATEEPQVVQLSLQQRLERAETALAEERARAREQEIEALVQSGRVAPARAQKWRETLNAKRLSLVTQDGALEGTLSQIESAHDVPEGTFWTAEQKAAASTAPQEEPVDWDGTGSSGEVKEHVMSRLCPGWKAEKNGKEAQ